MRSFRRAALPVVVLSIFILLSAFCFGQQAPVLVTQPIDNSVRTTLKGNVHPLARAEYDQGEVPASTTLHRMMLVLKRSDQQESALRLLIDTQQNSKSPNYKKWMTPEEFGKQFGPADSDVAAVVGWLQASGFAVNHVSNGRTVIEFDGTAGLVKQAFGTSLHQYHVHGEDHIANSTDPTIPTALAPVVAGINSLHNFFKKSQNAHVGTYSEETKKLTQKDPSYTFAGCGGVCYAVSPYDFATIYDVLPLWNANPAINGTGETIAIVGRTDINPADATTFWSLFGLDGTHAPQPTLNIITNGPDPGFTSDEPEADIDTQWSGAVAPGATIDFVTSASTETDDGIDLSAIYIVDNNLAPVMSESYGECEIGLGSSGVQFYGYMWEQAAAQGMSVMVSTGDSGSAGCDDPDSEQYAVYGMNVNGIASTPWNAAVGGTDFNQFNTWSTYWNGSNSPITQESAKSYIPETTWDDSCTNPLFVDLGYGGSAEAVCNSGFQLNISGGSGGESGYSGYGGGAGTAPGWSKPSWQKGTGVPNDSARDLPDVSLFASNGFLDSFYVICQSDVSGPCNLTNLQGYGGTSVASPTFAGIMALVNQKYGPQGVPGLILYSLASKQASAFHDINTSVIDGKAAGTTTIQMPCEAGSTVDCIGSGADGLGVLQGWTTGTGYDEATGLGSVDANVLVSNWNKVTFTGTTNTLTISPTTFTHGANVTVGVTVAPQTGSGTPTGDVSILVSPKPGAPSIDWNNLTDGTVSWVTTLLPGGSYQVISHYGGDTNYGGSYSSPSATLTVSPEASFVYMGSPAGLLVGIGTYGNSVVYGTGDFDDYLLRADVQNSAQAFCTSQVLGEIACPTGTISLTDNGNKLDASPYTLNSLGYTEDQTIQLTGGTHTIAASYSGDQSYKASSTSFSVTVTPAVTSISNVSAPGSANAGQSFTVSATVAAPLSYGIAPTGTVVFYANGTALSGTVQYSPQAGNYGTGLPASLGATLTTSLSTAGTYTITAAYTTGDGNYSSQSSSNSVQIVINATSSFTLSANPTSVTIAPGGAAGTSTITVNPVDGFTGNVTLAASGAPTGVTATFSPNPTATTSTLSLTASGSVAAGTYPITITGTSGSLSATTTVSLTVAAGPSFTLSASPTSVMITPGLAGGTSTITITDVGGFSGNVTLAATGQPSGVTASFSPNPATTTSVLTLTASGSTTPGTYTVTVMGTSGAITATTNISLTVTQPPNFTVSASPSSLTINQASTGTSTITVTSTNGFNSSVALTATGLPTGVTAAFVPSSVTPPANGSGTSTLTLTVGTSVATGSYPITINGKSGSTTQTTTVTLTVAQPFTLSDSPGSVTIVPGATGGTSTVTVTDHNGFSGTVSLSASGVPSGVTANFNPGSTSTSSTLTLTASATAAPTTATITITGVSSGVTTTTSIALTVVQNFTLPGSVAAPPSANPGQSTTTMMSVATADGGAFTSNVTFTCPSGLPTGASCLVTSIASGASSPQTVNITVNTAGPFSGPAGGVRREERKLRGQNRQPWLPLTVPLVGVVFVGLAGRRVSRGSKVALLCLALALTGFLVACGSGSSTPIVVTVSPSSVTTLWPNLGLAGEATQTQQFTATVTGTTNTSVTWSVAGGSANGTIDQTGLYTAPAATPAGSVTVTATTATSPAESGNATVTIQTPTPAGTSTVTLQGTEGTVTNSTSFSLVIN